MLNETGVETWPEEVILDGRHQEHTATMKDCVSLYLQLVHATPEHYLSTINTPIETLISELISCIGESWSSGNIVHNFHIFSMPELKRLDGYHGVHIPATLLYIVKAYLDNPQSLYEPDLLPEEVSIIEYLLQNLIPVLKPQGRLEPESVQVLSIMKVIAERFRNKEGKIVVPKDKNEVYSLAPMLNDLGYDEGCINTVLDNI